MLILVLFLVFLALFFLVFPSFFALFFLPLFFAFILLAFSKFVIDYNEIFAGGAQADDVFRRIAVALGDEAQVNHVDDIIIVQPGFFPLVLVLIFIVAIGMAVGWAGDALHWDVKNLGA